MAIGSVGNAASAATLMLKKTGGNAYNDPKLNKAATQPKNVAANAEEKNVNNVNNVKKATAVQPQANKTAVKKSVDTYA